MPHETEGFVVQMNLDEPTSRPDWISGELYPFESRFFTTSPDHRMHYIDEGVGEPLVFVHGNPSWSFEFRHLIQELRSDFRCLAPDHIGFGLSSRSVQREDHHPESHAHRFAALLDHLDLRDITLFMNDWGGPIGLDFARRHPERVRRLVIANSWCWPVSDDFHFKSFSFLMSSWIGQYLIRHHNMFVNKVMPKAVGDRSILTPEIMTHYRNAQPSPAARAANAALPGYITGASDWLCSIWGDRGAFVDKPVLLLWGLKDIAFRRKELERWKSELPNHKLYIFEDCGHFLAEEAPDRVISAIRDFLEQE
ncbi:MAG: alpha/beta fold hydrolase [Rhodobacteraceae bacterium]|nr:alpha/beta fold hydrolase [Paracoccaceae bacterium]